MTDEPIDHYQRALTALDAGESNLTSQSHGDDMRRIAMAQYCATVALARAVLALAQEARTRG